MKHNDWHIDIHQAIERIGKSKGLTKSDLLGYLASTLCGQFVVCGFNEEFVKASLKRMFESYLKIKERVGKEK